MKLKGKYIEKDQSGYVRLIPEEFEDLWHLYNLICVGDVVTAKTFRKIQKESNTGTVTNDRIQLTIPISVTDVQFDPGDENIRISGTNTSSDNQHVKFGAYHTIEVKTQRPLKLWKAEWDTISLGIVNDACDISKTADVGAIVMQEGLANVCLITGCMTVVRARIEVTIPRKRKGGSSRHDKATEKFFDQVLEAMLRFFDFSVLKAVIVASPGFIKDEFGEYLWAEAQKRGIKPLLESKGKFIFCHSSTGHKRALRDILSDPAIVEKLTDTKAAMEVKKLNQFYQVLGSDPAKAFYGFNHVQAANAQNAIDTLLVTDNLFRAMDIETRRKYIKLVDSAKENGADVFVLSGQHASGEQLNQLTGVAAILRFPLPDIEDMDLSDGENAKEEAPEA